MYPFVWKIYYFFVAVFFMCTARALDDPQGVFKEFNIPMVRNLFSDSANYKEYQGQAGYLLFVERVPRTNNMETVFERVSKALGENFESLNWKKFYGNTSQFESLKPKILDEAGQLKEEYIGREGYVRFSEEHYKGGMYRAFGNVSAVLDKLIFQKLGWQKFPGSVSEYKSLESRILDEEGQLKEEYKGMKGCALFSGEYYEGDMSKAFLSVSAKLDKVQFKDLDWQHFHGHASDFESLRTGILDKKGRLKRKYMGMDGYALFSREYYKGDMSKTFINASAALSKAQFRELGWQQFQGSVSEFESLRYRIVDDWFLWVLMGAHPTVSQMILNKRGNLRMEYIGAEGYIRFSRKYYKGDMHKAFTNVSALLSKEEFKKLGWQRFKGHVSEFRTFRSRILDKAGYLKAGYKGMEGYVRFSKRYYEGDMFKTFQDVSAVLDKELFKELDWQSFKGHVSEFESLRSWILDEIGRPREKYIGMKGYVRFSKEYYEGKMHRTFVNVSAFLDRSVFKKLKWQVFHSNASDFESLQSEILDEMGQLREKYIGQDGYITFSKEYHEGNMHKAFVNVSAVLGGHLVMEELGLGWIHFDGSVSEYENLFRLFAKNALQDFRGIKGKQRVAKEIFKGNGIRAYRNISVLRELLLGCREAFKELQWSRSH